MLALIAIVTFISNGTSTHLLPEFIGSAHGLHHRRGRIILWGVRARRGALSYEVAASGSVLTPIRLTADLRSFSLPLVLCIGVSAAHIGWAAGGFVLGAWRRINNGLTPRYFETTLPYQLVFAAEGLTSARRTSVMARSPPNFCLAARRCHGLLPC